MVESDLKAFKFIGRRVSDIPTVKLGTSPPIDVFSRATSLAALAGLGTALAGPGLFGQAVDHSHLEEATGLAAIGAGIFGMIRISPKLCRPQDWKHWRNWAGEPLSMSVAGLGTAGAVAALYTGHPLIDGAIVATGLVVPGGLTAAAKLTPRSKLCPGLLGGEQHKGKCNQKICRTCFALFVPDESMRELNCNKKYLDWYNVASHLQFQGFSYLDSEILISNLIADEYWRKAIVVEPPGNDVLFLCSRYREWFDLNDRKIARFLKCGKPPNGNAGETEAFFSSVESGKRFVEFDMKEPVEWERPRSKMLLSSRSSSTSAPSIP